MPVSPDQVVLRTGRLEDEPVLTRLLTQDFEGSRLVRLGPRFLRLLHRHILTSEHSICLIAERGGEVVGAGALVTSSSRFNRSFVVRKGVRSALATAPYLLRPSNLKTLLKGLTYFSGRRSNDADAEVITLIVSATATRSGIGARLFQALAAEARRRGVTRFKLITSTENEASNAFYARQGCIRLRTDPFYRDTTVNVYEYRSD